MSAVLSLGYAGCKYGGPTPAEGIPEVALASISDAGIVAQDPNPCEIDVDFGTVSMEQEVAASIEVENLGFGELAVSQVNPTLDPEFGLNYGTQQPIEPGELDEFTVTFQPYMTGQVQSSFTIQTDGTNEQCPTPTGGNSIMTVQLTGTGASIDAGS